MNRSGWIFSVRAKRPMQEDLSVAIGRLPQGNAARAGAQARHYDSGGVRLPTENLTS